MRVLEYRSEIGENCGKGSLWVKEKKEQLKSVKRYLKGDYKVLVFLVNCFILNVLAKQKFVTFCYLNKTYRMEKIDQQLN